MTIEKLVYQPIDIRDYTVTLLSKEEYLKNKEFIPLLKDAWWLCSQGPYDSRAMYVDGGSGDIYDFGSHVRRILGMRPALKIQDCHNLVPGDKIRISGYVFTILHENLAICDTCICRSIFDYESNNFETSYIRSYLYNWAKENNITFKKE